MKSFKLFTTSLLAGLLAAGGGTAAFAAEASDTIYPQDTDFIKPLTFAALTDYAVNGEDYAFAENKTVSVYQNKNLTVYAFEEKIAKLDCREEVYYCTTESGQAYSFTFESAPEKTEYAIPEAGTSIDVGNFNYRVFMSSLKISDYLTDEITSYDGDYTELKEYGGKVYAICENSLYSFAGTERTLIELEYIDYSSTSSIKVGNTADELKENYTLRFVTVQSGAFMTKIDLAELDGEYFAAGDTVTAKEDTVALLLCYASDEAAIIAIGDQSYITRKDKTALADVKCAAAPEFGNATITGNRIYASPYVIAGTTTLPNAAGTIVKVTKKLQLANVLGSAFYEVEYTVDGETRMGYVADGFLTEFIIEDNKEPNVVTDPEYSEKNDVKTVLLVLAVVTLVLIAVGYLAYVGTADKSKKRNKKQKTAQTEADK